MANWWTTPIVPEAPVRRLQEELDAPELERSPWEARLRGFGAGALEGLREQTTPLNLAGLVGLGTGIGGGLRAARAAPGALQGLSKALPGIDLLGELPQARQVLPAAEDVNSLVGSLKYNLAKLPPRAAPLGPTLSQMGGRTAEFAPRGGEALYNISRSGAQQAVDPVAQAYARILARGGR